MFLRIVFMFTSGEKKPFHNHGASSLLIKYFMGNYQLIYDSENDWDKEKCKCSGSQKELFTTISLNKIFYN